MTTQFLLTVTIVDGDTGQSRTVHDMPVLKGLPRDARVQLLAQAFARVFDEISRSQPPALPTQQETPR